MDFCSGGTCTYEGAAGTRSDRPRPRPPGSGTSATGIGGWDIRRAGNRRLGNSRGWWLRYILEVLPLVEHTSPPSCSCTPRANVEPCILRSLCIDRPALHPSLLLKMRPRSTRSTSCPATESGSSNPKRANADDSAVGSSKRTRTDNPAEQIGPGTEEPSAPMPDQDVMSWMRMMMQCQQQTMERMGDTLLAIQQQGRNAPAEPAAQPHEAQEDVRELTGTEQPLFDLAHSRFPGVPARHIRAILRNKFDPTKLYELRTRKSVLDDNSDPIKYSLADGKIVGTKARDLHGFKSFYDWSEGFITFFTLYSCLFRTLDVVINMNLFYLEVCQAATKYDFREAVLPFAIGWHDAVWAKNLGNASNWWPVDPLFVNHHLNPATLKAPRPTAGTPTQPSPRKSFPDLCQNHLFKDGGCTFRNCSRRHLSAEEIQRLKAKK